MLRHQPTSTLFPYTTLFRSIGLGITSIGLASAALSAVEPARAGMAQPPRALRSEEHTSELQSHSDLVCRLLLEKKKIEEMSGEVVGNAQQQQQIFQPLISH